MALGGDDDCCDDVLVERIIAALLGHKCTKYYY